MKKEIENEVSGIDMIVDTYKKNNTIREDYAPINDEIRVQLTETNDLAKMLLGPITDQAKQDNNDNFVSSILGSKNKYTDIKKLELGISLKTVGQGYLKLLSDNVKRTHDAELSLAKMANDSDNAAAANNLNIDTVHKLFNNIDKNSFAFDPSVVDNVQLNDHQALTIAKANGTLVENDGVFTDTSTGRVFSQQVSEDKRIIDSVNG